MQLSYFKEKGQFFTFKLKDVKEDIKYILSTYFNAIEISNWNLESNQKIGWKQRKQILELEDFKEVDKEICKNIELKLSEYIDVDIKIDYLFWKCISILIKERYAIPKETIIKNIVNTVYKKYEKELYSKLELILDSQTKLNLENLLLEEIERRKLITNLKSTTKGFNADEISKEIEKQKSLRILYETSKKVFLTLNLKPNSIKYLYTLVLKYKADKISSWKNPHKKYLYLLGFINYRFSKFNDDFVITFQALTGKYYGLVKKEAQNKINEETKEILKDVIKFEKILNYIDEKTDYDEDIFKEVKIKFEKILPLKVFTRIKKQIVRNTQKSLKYRWQAYEDKHPTMVRNLRPIIRNLNFSFSKELEKSSFKEAFLQYLQFVNQNKKPNWSEISKNWILKKNKEFICINKVWNEKRLEVLLFNTLRNILNKEKYILQIH